MAMSVIRHQCRVLAGRLASPAAAYLAAVSLLVLALPSAVQAQASQAGGEAMSDQDVIERALSAAPEHLRADASVMGPDGRVLKEGDGGFTCMFTGPDIRTASPLCLDETYKEWAQAWENRDESYSGPDRVGLAYMLAPDSAGGGASNVDPFAEGPTADNQWVVEGPHVMIIAPLDSLQELSSDPNSGEPYVMWSGTPFAHIMMPTGPRPAPAVAEAD